MRTIHLLLLALGLSLLPTPALARVLDPGRIVDDTANGDLKEGFARYEAMEFAEGMKAFDSALADSTLTPAERAAAALYGGLMAHSLGDAARARDLFGQALAAVPDLELPSDTPPKDRLLFDEVMRTRRAQSPATADPTRLELDWADGPQPDEGVAPLYQRWWFWTGIGVLVASGTVAAILLTNGSDAKPCGSGGNGCIDVTLPAFRWGTP